MVDLTELQKITDTGKYRYWLWRENEKRTAESTKIAAWVLCNPSWSRRLRDDVVIEDCTRDYDDPTVQCVHDYTFNQSYLGNIYKSLFVVNLYPYRGSKPECLRGRMQHKTKEYKLGYNHLLQTEVLKIVFKYSDDLFFAWGGVAGYAGIKHFENVKIKVRDLAKCAGHKEYFFLKKTGDGHPKHPGRGFVKNKKLSSKIFQEKLCELKI